MTYQEAVTEAADALKRGEDANWELARLTFENTRNGGTSGQADRATMDQWCADIRHASGRRFSEANGKKYKAVWAKFGGYDHTDRPSWTDAYYEFNVSYTDRAEYFEATATRRLTEDASIETQRDVAAKLLSNPAVADAVISAPDTRRAVYESLNRREQAAETRRERITDADPVASGLRSMNALVEMDTVLGRFVQDFTDTFRQMAALPQNDPFANREFLTLRLNHAQECLDQLRSYLDTGKTDIDAFLESVLKGSN